MTAIVVFNLAGNLQPHGGLSGALLAKNNRRRRVGGIPVHLVPAGVEGAAPATTLENGMVCCGYLTEWKNNCLKLQRC